MPGRCLSFSLRVGTLPLFPSTSSLSSLAALYPLSCWLVSHTGSLGPVCDVEIFSASSLCLLLLDTSTPLRFSSFFFFLCTPSETISFECKDVPGPGGCFCLMPPHPLNTLALKIWSPVLAPSEYLLKLQILECFPSPIRSGDSSWTVFSVRPLRGAALYWSGGAIAFLIFHKQVVTPCLFSPDPYP